MILARRTAAAVMALLVACLLTACTSGTGRDVRPGAQVQVTKFNGARMVQRQSGDGPVGDADVDAAFDAANTVLRYFKYTLGRSSFDGDGAPVVVNVFGHGDNVRLLPKWWNSETRHVVFDQDCVTVEGMATVLALAVIRDEVGPVGPTDEMRAVEVAFADVIAAALDGNWLVGDREPGGPYGDIAAPAHVADYIAMPTGPELSSNSRVVSHAAYLLADKIGKEKALQVAWKALVEFLRPNATFEDVHSAFLRAAADRYGRASRERRAVTAAFGEVGLTGRWSPEA